MNNFPNQPEQLKNSLNEVMDSPEQLADRIADIFECPITIEDSNHHVVSYSKHTEKIDEARIGTIMNRKVPDKVINGLWKKGVMPRLIDSDDPIIIPEMKEIGLGNRVAVSIRKKNEILGFIWAHTGDKKLSEEKLQLLKEAALLVKKFFLKRRQRKRKSEEGNKDFFWQLLTGDITDNNEIQQQAKQFNMVLEGKMAIVVIQFPANVTEQMEKHAYYLSETRVNVQVVSRLFDENKFIMLVRFIKEDHPSKLVTDFIHQFIEKISDQLNLQGILGSSGIVVEAPHKIKDSYKQAEKVLEMKAKFPEELQYTYLYDELGVYQFIDELYKIRKQQNNKNKYIEKLQTYDTKHRTSLLPTLRAYLQSDCNVYDAAKQLFIHPNTMNYRLKRIREVAELNLKDPNQKTAIYLDLIVENMTET
ncbi:PucR family transcriptional regulator [Oceanobacillus salinisoli]|uniref:PucR family transcriptional regulator n=1 Tax=Oceanobacillus salinisoli TaxID=2678611 RepID=UPI0012E1D4D6|nr:helix-turn-helix domain-containing protein [Oceanobacillus salinisoli]